MLASMFAIEYFNENTVYIHNICFKFFIRQCIIDQS